METHYQPSTTNYNYSYHQDQYHRRHYYGQNVSHWQEEYSYQNYYNGNYDNWYHHHQQHQQDQDMLGQSRVMPAVEVVTPVPACETALALSNVVTRILNYCSIQDLKQCRRVCNVWALESSKILRDRVTIHFNRRWQLASYFKRMKNHRDFCSTFSFGSEISLDDSFVKDWIMGFGPHIFSLELRTDDLQAQSICQSLQYMPNLETLILPSKILFSYENKSTTQFTNVAFQLPKLKYLTFVRDSQDETIHPMPLFRELLRISPNLEHIKIHGPPSCSLSSKFLLNHPDITDLNVPSSSSIENSVDLSYSLDSLLWLNLIKKEGESTVAQNLKKLDFNIKLGYFCVQSLVAKNFPLKCIDLKILPEVSNKALHQLLTSLKNTLVDLKIRYCGSGRLAYESDLPLTDPLPQLRFVHLERYQGSLWFVEKLPNLGALSFSRTNLNRVVLKDAECPLKPEGVHGSLKSFKVYQDSSNNEGSNRQRSIQTVQKLGMQFPSLKTLRLEKLVDESLCLIYAQWPNLEGLEIVQGHFTDSGVTAIHPNAYKVIHREEAYDNFNVDALRQGLFLGNLSKLTTLKIHSPNITDVSLILGVLPCPAIQNVCVQSFKITDTSLYRLVCKPSIIRLGTKNCNQLSTAATDYAKSVLSRKGGGYSLSKCQSSFNVLQTVQFLERHPKLRVLLKRLSSKTVKIKQKPEKIPKRRKQNPPPEKLPTILPQAQTLTTTPTPSPTPQPKPKPIPRPRMRIRPTRCYNKREKVQNVKNVIANVAETISVVKEIEIVEPCTNPVTPVPIISPAKFSRPVRNTESIFRRFKDFALF